MDERTKIAMEAYRMMYETQVEETEELDEAQYAPDKYGRTAGGAWYRKDAQKTGGSGAWEKGIPGDVPRPTPGSNLPQASLNKKQPMVAHFEPEGEQVDELFGLGQKKPEQKPAQKPKPTGGLINRGLEQRNQMLQQSGSSGRYGVERNSFEPEGEVVGEDVDIFDTILDYLVSEGYADTNENALVIVSNMSEEWKKEILENL